MTTWKQRCPAVANRLHDNDIRCRLTEGHGEPHLSRQFDEFIRWDEIGNSTASTNVFESADGDPAAASVTTTSRECSGQPTEHQAREKVHDE
ncbi:hypothetical protein AB0E01_00165 [Nocardia vinacea]|uniref:hypothetical protein n=1 Tax=Nocardia vinacea TaxID=96468 RepID=UPI0033DC9EB5